ncbi:T6SS immunity protein Tli4 family protein [Pseudomonas putida]|uniref:T6SS immunity protein Tli4 family protein n=1 Tax=Pseudomonas putida TaxID=303 RepID=UPI00300EF0AF
MLKSMIKKILLGSTLTIALLAGAESGAQEMLDNYQDFYFGRYTFKAPTDGANIWSAYKVIKKRIELISINGKRDIIKVTEEAIAEINKLHKSGYPAYDQTIGLEGGGAIVVSKGEKYNLEIYYLTKKNTLYRQKVEFIPPYAIDKAIDRAREVNKLIGFRNPSQEPPPGTFAIEAGYMNLPLNKFDEQVSIGLPVSSVPGIHLTFDTQMIGKPEPGLISRYEQRSSGIVMPLLQNILSNSTLLRKTKRSVSGLPFEELLLKTKAEGKTLYSFRLEYPGTPESSLEPYIVLELSTVDEGPGFKNDEEALHFWDEMVSSLRRF